MSPELRANPYRSPAWQSSILLTAALALPEERDVVNRPAKPATIPRLSRYVSLLASPLSDALKHSERLLDPQRAVELGASGSTTDATSSPGRTTADEPGP